MLGPDAPADAIARLEHDHALAGLLHASGRGEARVTGADHADVSVDPFRHRQLRKMYSLRV
jgi:hypothetical protein